MNSPLSLVQELRGIRGGPKQMHADLEGLLAQIEEARREWQTEIDQAQHIFRDLLATISDLSGVELPNMALDDDRPGNASLRVGFKTLKERIRNDLEAYSSTAASELGKRAHEQGQTILEPLQKEMSERLDNLAEEFRKKVQERMATGQDEVTEQAKMQAEQIIQAKMDEFAQWINLMSEGVVSSVPQKVEKAVEPQILEVTDRLKASFQQQLHFVLHDQEKASQQKVEELQSAIQGQIERLAQEAQHASQQSADMAVKSFTERLGGVTDEAFKNFESKAGAGVQKNLDHFGQRLGELSASAEDGLRAFTDQQAEGLRQRLQTVAQELEQKSAAGISTNIDKITQDALASSLQNLRTQLEGALEASKGELKTSMKAMLESAQGQMSNLGQSAHDSLSRDVAELASNLKKLGEELKTAEDKRVAATKAKLDAMTQGTIDSVGANMKQMVDRQVADVQKALAEFQTQLSADHEQRFQNALNAQENEVFTRIQEKANQVTTQATAHVQGTSDQIVAGLSETVNKEVNTATSLLKDWARQTTTWAESTIKSSLESYRGDIAQMTSSALEHQRQTIHSSIGDLQSRLEQAAGLLRGLNGTQPGRPDGGTV